MKAPYLYKGTILDIVEPFSEKVKNKIDCTGKMDISCDYDILNLGLNITISINRKSIVGWSFNFIPGNTEIAFSTNTFVNPKYRGLGIASIVQECKFKLAREMGIKKLYCTVNCKNTPQLHIMNRFGWKNSDWYKNSSNQIVKLFSKNLAEVE